MVNVLVTGGAGFLGSRLARDLLATGSLEVTGSGAQPLDRLAIADQAAVPADLAADPRVTAVQGDLGGLLSPRTGPPGGPGVLAGIDVIFHLAAAVSGECEADFDLGIRANLRATEALLAACRALGTSPLVVFASSLAAFGDSRDHRLPAVVGDQTLPNPQTSYGVQKVICEQLVADYTRKGFLRGRSLRLMTVCVRPGRPNAAASGFLSSIIRERAVCPVGPQTAAALASPAKTVQGLRRAAAADDESWGGRSAVTLPALTVTVEAMVAALAQVAGPKAPALIDWIPDPAIDRMMSGWAARVQSDRAERLGLVPDPDFASIIEMHLAETQR
jgi:nucleoside-diphosphate-sugar epimerase